MSRSTEEKRLVVKMMRLNTKKLTLEQWKEFKGGIEKLYRNRQKMGFLKRCFSQLFRCLEKCRINDRIDLKLFSEYQKEIIHVNEHQIMPHISVPGLFVSPRVSFYKKVRRDSGTIWTATLARRLTDCLSYMEVHAETDQEHGIMTWEGESINDLCSFPVNENDVESAAPLPSKEEPANDKKAIELSERKDESILGNSFFIEKK